ncbi:MAG: 50S ribosomal protein L29 [Gammaproteobacteria bacterium]
MSKEVKRREELRKKNAEGGEGLRPELTALRQELFNLRMQKAMQQTQKTSELKRVKRDIARTLTIAREVAASGKAE